MPSKRLHTYQNEVFCRIECQKKSKHIKLKDFIEFESHQDSKNVLKIQTQEKSQSKKIIPKKILPIDPQIKHVTPGYTIFDSNSAYGKRIHINNQIPGQNLIPQKIKEEHIQQQLYYNFGNNQNYPIQNEMNQMIPAQQFQNYPQQMGFQNNLQYSYPLQQPMNNWQPMNQVHQQQQPIYRMMAQTNQIPIYQPPMIPQQISNINNYGNNQPQYYGSQYAQPNQLHHQQYLQQMQQQYQMQQNFQGFNNNSHNYLDNQFMTQSQYNDQHFRNYNQNWYQ
eukprot:403350338